MNVFDAYSKLMGSMDAAVGGGVYKFSEEHKSFCASGYKCSSCSKSALGFTSPRLNYYSGNGKQLSFVVHSTDLFLYKSTLGFTPSAELVECQKCGYRWEIYKKGQANIPKQKLEVSDIIETDRSEEIIGVDRRLIDNSKSSSRLTRKFSINREWSKVYSIEYEKAQANGIELGVGVSETVSVKATSEESIRKKYFTSEESREICSEEVEVEIPASTKLNLAFQWKRIWQHGFILLRNENNEESRIPFRVVVGITFDQSQIDEKI
jgi:DNA-directed RNA polymerase subunit RPC12/RpoP